MFRGWSHTRTLPCIHFIQLSYSYNLYRCDISHDPKQWTAAKFFKALFDDIFPVNCCLEQCEKLDRFYQNNKTVKTYAAKSVELFMSIGFSDNYEHIWKLWKGSHHDTVDILTIHILVMHKSCDA